MGFSMHGTPCPMPMAERVPDTLLGTDYVVYYENSASRRQLNQKMGSRCEKRIPMPVVQDTTRRRSTAGKQRNDVRTEVWVNGQQNVGH